MKYLLVLLSFLFLFACAKEETKPVVKAIDMSTTETGVSESSGTLIPPNEKTTQAEQEFARELNTLLNTVEETPNE